jgi:hypothetical protein
VGRLGHVYLDAGGQLVAEATAGVLPRSGTRGTSGARAVPYAERMDVAGRESWRIGIGGAPAVHALLFIRDALRLTPAGADVPPPLVGDVPEVELGLSAHEGPELSEAWLDWWRRFIHVEGATERGAFARGLDPNVGRARQRAAVFGVFDPPGFASLAGSPPLQESAQQLGDRALKWGSGHASGHRGAAPERKAAWLAQKSMAESVIEEYQVSPGRVSAGIIVLTVTGQWSNIPEPGVLLCSEEFFADSELFLPALKRAFETGLRAVLHP